VKRVMDIAVAATALLVTSPLLIVLALAIWLQDRHSPVYAGMRIGWGKRPFPMIKFRSMVVRASASGVDSTAGDDPRITRLGKFIRAYKLDELPELLNVLVGQMSLVGPRPNVPRETDRYTPIERELLSVRPGITDLASIVFADEAEILRGSTDPDLLYNQTIRPWKSRLGLLYVRSHAKVRLDLRILALTVRAALNRGAALESTARLVAALGGDPELIEVARRTQPLRAAPPPGASSTVQSRDRTAA
jgi:lipopolysaccharide/colanic/teichoic acid biosynthesis glycosyltransferase